MCAEWSNRFAWGRGRNPSSSSESGSVRSGRHPSGSSNSSASLGRPNWKRPDDRKRERLNSELLSAVCRSDLFKVRRLLKEENGLNPSAYCSQSKASTPHIAAINGDIDILKVLVEAGVDLEWRDSDGRLPLHLAAWAGSSQCTDLILQRKPALINSKVMIPGSCQCNPGEGCGWEHNHQEVSDLMYSVNTEEGVTALHVASMHCQQGIVELLLQRGANVQEMDRMGRTALDVAGVESCTQQPVPSMFPSAPYTPSSDNYIDGGNVGPTAYSSAMNNSNVVMTSAFFRPPSEPSTPKPWTSSQQRSIPKKEGPLFPQLEMPKTYSIPLDPVGMDGVGVNINKALHDIVSKLMSSGAKIAEEQTDSTQMGSSSALQSAIASDDVSVMELLLDSGASLRAFNGDGDTPLHYAVRRRKFGALKVIVERLKEGEIDLKNKYGYTALHVAVAIEWPEGVGFLLESRASVKIKTDGDGETVYHIAAKLGNPKLMEEILLVEGSSEVINEKDSDGLTPLLCAVQRPSDVVVVQLIKTAKADVGVLLKDGSNILHYAVSESDASVLSYLTSLPSCKRLINEVSPPESNGMAPLHVAAENGNVDFTEILLKAGANPNLHTTNDPKGKMTALHLAAKNGFRRTVEVILKYDTCSLNSENKYGWKPLHTACAYGHGKTAIVLIKKGADLSDEIEFHGTTKTAFDLMAVNVPRSSELLEGLLDSYIEVPTRKGVRDMKFLYNPSCAITLNFEVLLSTNDPSGRQLTFLNSIVNSNSAELKELLLHPLIEIFLHIKWEKLWKFFAILLFFYLLHTLALTAYCAVIFIAHYQNIPGRAILQLTFLSSLVPIVLAEAMQFLRQHRQYWKDHESWLKLLMILTSGTVGYGTLFAEDTEWIRHFSSFAILSSWIELLFLASRFKYWGLDVLMFEKVIENVLTVLSKFMFLFLGFMFALMIHFEGAKPFTNVFDSFFQSVVMVVELNYGGMFPESSADINALIGRFIYVCYMVFVALAMMNLTVGLAVSDIAALEKQGRVENLVKRTSFLSFLETLVYNDRVARCFPAPRADKSRSHSFRSIDAVYTVYPNKPGVLPLYLKSALLLKVQDPEKTESLTTEHFDDIIKEVTNKVEKISQELAALQKK
ncbi:hypothetical protein GE061_012694 [Apolygus lucorum]|uniref:Ion transport domain-containing protein n=1 Tax=Apolygus lucorum TaxID=248454 RepID=A0A8S9XTA1_APOLU|nr:hypothetical protein GE061_012694 [Apolygus lucorum]